MTAEEKRQRIAELSLSQAKKFSQENEFSRSLPHFLVYAQLRPEDFASTCVPDFLRVVHAVSYELEREQKISKIFQVYEQALEILPDNPELLTNYGSHLFKQKRMQEAERAFRRALDKDSDFLLARDRLENMSCTLLDRWHFPMLNDVGRNTKFKRAITRLVQAGCSRVLDVGAGTGLLSLLAAQAGASQVYACEASEVMVHTAGDVLRVNPAGEKVQLIPRLSLDLTSAEIPPPISLLVTETFDAGLLGEHVLESLAHAWQNLLSHPSPTQPLLMKSCVLPARAELFVVPIQCHNIAKCSRNLSDKFGYLNTAHLKITSNIAQPGSSEPYTTENLSSVPGGYTLLGQPKSLFTIDFQNKAEVIRCVNSGRSIALDFPVTADGQCDAVAAWFSLYLDDEETISTEPGQDTCWHQAIFPVTDRNNKVYRGNSSLVLRFWVHKHVELSEVEFRWVQKIHTNGSSQGSRWSSRDQEVELILPSFCIRSLNTNKLEEILQWVAYYASKECDCSNLLDTSAQLPLLALQIMKLVPTAKLTLSVDTGEDASGKDILDFITNTARANTIHLANISCITGVPEQEGGGYTLAILAPILSSGRLDENVLLGLDEVVKALAPGRGLILPHKLQLWCQVVESNELAVSSHLRSNEPVLGLSIADQINVLAVTHLQELQLAALNKTDLTDPCHVRDISLTGSDPSRQIQLTSIPLIASGNANAVVYWFVMEYGWGLSFSTLEGGVYSQAAVMCKEMRVDKGGTIQVVCQMERGLLHFSFRQ